MFPYYPAIRCWKASVAMQESRVPQQNNRSSLLRYAYAICTFKQHLPSLACRKRELVHRLHDSQSSLGISPACTTWDRGWDQIKSPTQCNISNRMWNIFTQKDRRQLIIYSILCKSICFIHQLWETEHRTALKTKAMFQPSLCQGHYVYMHHIFGASWHTGCLIFSFGIWGVKGVPFCPNKNIPGIIHDHFIYSKVMTVTKIHKKTLRK